MGSKGDKLLPFNKVFPDCRRLTTPGNDTSCSHCTAVFSAYRRSSALKQTQWGSHSDVLSDLECLNPPTARRIRATNRLNLCQSEKYARLLYRTLHVSCFTTTEHIFSLFTPESHSERGWESGCWGQNSSVSHNNFGPFFQWSLLTRDSALRPGSTWSAGLICVGK